jgi:hypothetical protein
MTTPDEPTIKSLFPALSDADAREAEENLAAYLALVIRVYQRISQDPQALAELQKSLRSDVEYPFDTFAVSAYDSDKGRPPINPRNIL